MKLKTRLKIKKLWFYILGVITLVIIESLAVIMNKGIETSITIFMFYIYRNMFEKQFHAKSLYLCSFISIIVFIVVINLEVNLATSILVAVLITFLITTISYYVRDYLDYKLIINKYSQDIKSFNKKRLESMSEQEIVNLMPDVDEDIIHIVYGYLHRDKNLKASGYAYQNGISEATLYRYLKQVRTNFNESLG